MLPLVNAYLDGEDEVVLVERDGERAVERRIRAEYVTFHRKVEVSASLMRRLKASEQVISIREEGSWLRVAWADDFIRRRIRKDLRDDEHVETYEGDVDPVLLYLVESRAVIAKPRRCYLDIETDSRVSLAEKEKMRVLSWAVVDHETGEAFSGVIEADTDAAERTLLEALMVVLDAYDQICVWEGDWKDGAFDSVVLPARARRAGLGVDFRRFIFLNQLAVWRKMNMQTAESGAEKESLALENIAQEQIGEGKERVPAFVKERFGKRADRGLGRLAWDLWEAGGEFRALLVAYNIRDAMLLRKLEKKKNFIQLFQAICELCGLVPILRSLNPTRQMDGRVLRLGREEDKRFPTVSFFDDSESDEEEKGQFKGAVVFKPRSVAWTDEHTGEVWTKEQAASWCRSNGFRNGILRNVHVCDFSGMYPSVMITFNLSSEMKRGWAKPDHVLEDGTCVSPLTRLITATTEPGLIPRVQIEMIALRKQYSDLAATLPSGTPEWEDANALSNGAKVTANAFYGAGGNKYCRFHDRDIAEATTQNAVHFLRLAAREAESRSMALAYGDTDSNLVVGPSIKAFGTYVDWLNSKRFPAEVKNLGCRENRIKIAFEKTYSRIVFVAAKMYVASPLHYKGSTTCNVCTKPDKSGKSQPGSVDVKTLTCRDCGHVYAEIPKFLGKPDIKGLRYKRGDGGKLVRKLQGKAIDMLVGGLKEKLEDGTEVPINGDLETPTEEIAIYEKLVAEMRDYVMTGDLPVEEVQLSKSISKPLKEYGKVNADGKESVEAHVRVARELVLRGHVIGAKSRVEYVVVDGDTSPQQVIPAEDYAGECDRFWLWERTWSPTRDLLAAAFPDVDWTRFDAVRERKPRGRSKVAEEQLGFQLAAPAPPKPLGAEEEIAMPAWSAKPVAIRVPEEAGKEALERVKKVLIAHPGARAAEITIVLRSGAEAVVKTPFRVTTGPRLKAALARAITGA